MKKWVPIAGVVLSLGVIVVMSDRQGSLREGEEAPEFTARLSTGEQVSLSDYRGKKNVVLFFYPKDFTAGCTKEVCSFRDNYDEIRKLDAILLGVSSDEDTTHTAFIQQNQLPFPLISDQSRTLCKAYGTTRLGGLFGLQKRVTYVIDKHGKIRGVAHHEYAIDRHLEDVLTALRKLQD
jgi:peroxiredoxin Q/BCP